jgi:hypothetical protein
MTSRLWLSILVFLALPAAARADIDPSSTWRTTKTFQNSPHAYIGPVGALNFSHPDTDQSTSFSAQPAASGGLLVGTRLTPSFGFDVSFLYLQRTSQSTQAIAPGVDADTSLTSKEIQIAPVARFWFNDYFSLGAGGYYGYGVGTIDAQLSSSAIPGGTLNQSVSYNDAHAQRIDGGLVASAALHLPISDSARLILDGRYTYGLVNLATDGSAKFRDVQALMGLGLNF